MSYQQGFDNEGVSIKRWLILFLICTFAGLFSFTTFYTQEVFEGGDTPYYYFLINEVSAAYSFFLILPFLFWFLRRFPFTYLNWTYMIPVHLLGSMICGALHTLLMTFSRSILYPIYGLGSYRMGDPLIRFVLEYQKQFLLYCFIGIIFYLIRISKENRERERRTSDLELQAAQLRSQLAESQLHALKGQLQPHFLFNSLNMISSQMYEDAEKADRMISRLSSLLRMSLENSDQMLVPLARELEFLEAYLDIMIARFEGRISFHQECDPALLKAQVPSFLLQPLAENCIKHNSIQANALKIELKIVTIRNKIQISITDNGTGGPIKIKEGFGLSSSRERLAQIYGSDQNLECQKLPGGGFRVSITIPLDFPEINEQNQTQAR